VLLAAADNALLSKTVGGETVGGKIVRGKTCFAVPL